MKTTVNVRRLMNIAKVKKAVDDGRDRALDRAGSMTRRSAQKQFSSRSPSKTPKWNRVGEYQGYPLVSLSFQTAKPNKVTTWKPKQFLKRKIFYAKDRSKGSVVVGPDEKVAKVQQLQEFGGSDPVKLRLISPSPVEGLYQYKVPRKFLGGRRQGRDSRGRFISNRRAYIGTWHAANARLPARRKVVATAAGRVPGRGFMGKGLQAVRSKIPQQFRNQLRGP